MTCFRVDETFGASAPTLLVRESAAVYRRAQSREILASAERVLRRFVRAGATLSNSDAVRHYLRVTLGTLEHECFAALWLTAQHQVIRYDVLFRGTVDGAPVYPREVVKSALVCNAAAVIFAHNHPSGVPEPSLADQRLTERLRSALTVIDVRLLDHVVVTATACVSFVERGWL